MVLAAVQVSVLMICPESSPESIRNPGLACVAETESCMGQVVHAIMSAC